MAVRHLAPIEEETYPAKKTAPAPDRPATDSGPVRNWRIRFVPGPDLMRFGSKPSLLIGALRELGNASVKAVFDAVPPLAKIEPERCYINWEIDFAIRDMAGRLDRLGAARKEAVVKLFGGNDVLTVSTNDLRETIGKQNSEAALRVLAEEGFAVTASCLGGAFGVHITFDTVTGEVLLRRLESGTKRRTRKSGCSPTHRSGQRR